MSEGKKLSRREFMKAAAFVGLGAGIAACAPTPAAPQQVEVTRQVEITRVVEGTPQVITATPAPTTVQAVPVDAGDQELFVMAWENKAFDTFNEDFTKETGIKVKNATFPSGSWSDVMHKYALWSQTGFSGYDLTYADDLIAGMMSANGYVADLSEFDCWSKHKDDVVPEVTALNKIVGGAYRIFFLLDLEPFFYYKKLVPEAPKTWSDMVAVGKSITKPKDDIWGWRPLNAAGHEFNTILMFLNQAGADMDTLSDSATLDAFKYMSDWVFTNQITPKSTVNEDPTTLNNLTAQGKAGMWWNYTGNFIASLNLDKTVLNMDTAGAARHPMGPKNDNGIMHGWGWMLPKTSKKKDMAIKYLNWMSEPDVMKRFVIDVIKNPPPYKSLINDPDVIKAVPTLGLPVGWETLVKGANFRAPIVTKKPVNELWNMFQNIGRFLFSGEKNPMETQTWAVSEYQRIMASV